MSTDRTQRRYGFVSTIIAGLSGLRGPAAASRPRQSSEKDESSGGPGYEVSDVNVGNTARVMAGLMVTALVVIGGMVWLRTFVAADQRQALPKLTAQQTSRLVPPPPNLQADPYADLDAERAAENRRLDGYAFLDASRQRARIPIDRAMALTVGRTLDP
ncbi:hypothetical protein AFCDBAGC_4648 [Methylobacterium cerastii]|uniref:Uncharacterized protein n=1 Tax=Methylobacterium cerastii TaxID=932741 RepID=A0ABQ4QNZ1_9HYPH|nr:MULTISPECIES: hypothetical protein [Methylobacterium]TXN09819.1 hypothetical protein FV219_06800 [Methylobacterium sp. WL122]TXM65464.1 hypothetical protein FV229_15565 [Methylobacterium sp. WL120]TXM68871.1 hypothetical protein FV226_19465 [Methylobacterium sp. WL12]TXM99536.1 hypothetical protein FV222_12915 [Methylobacterium sp. WL103]TXN78820.1 hypothetical protein FV234_22200 [Methylobacterium sp. WL8]